ncbi:S-adenosyl-L-methionine-dependent methyltransferase [Stereum hirsutum FP-91666 SS1]|uniref:S-adenosyl-L-methionine-dependent methyltransferase n=1 Tax=Stereum hirsutum (strain FP-91666) TaxID=721885 RepID=UPI000440B408|nr:S-adenosyl-L-methionine-dependent methyltransferase [Stereum hirsutum FP-91666 SS1]EIM91925.1 S-adenosyl-L-methionine-dependent methyltransferase [Stereum hirsutum FP-91666 SS1]
MSTSSIRALEFYSGIGGLHLALERSSVSGEVVQAFDWDQLACSVYNSNHEPKLARKVDIATLTPDILAAYAADLWLLSPSCQPYTVLNPQAKGADDPRAESFLWIVRTLLPGLKEKGREPGWVLIENVAGFETSSTRQILIEVMKSLGYHTIELLLTPLQFGIPNSRLRYYMLARKTPFNIPLPPSSRPSDPTSNECALPPEDRVWRHIPGRGYDWVDPRNGLDVESVENNVDEIRRYLDRSKESRWKKVVGEDGKERWMHPHMVSDRVLGKWGRLFDVVLPEARRTCCFTRVLMAAKIGLRVAIPPGFVVRSSLQPRLMVLKISRYTQLVERAGSILQENESLDTTATFDIFLKDQRQDDAYGGNDGADVRVGERSNGVEVLNPLQLRYFSPSELLRLFCFERVANDTEEKTEEEKGFVWPEGISTKSKYRLIGNSVNVLVVSRLIDFLFA